MDVFISEHGIISLIHPDGSGRIDLPGDGTASGPNWSPDGTQIAYDAAGHGNGKGAWDDLFVTSLDGKTRRALTHTLAYEGNATWSPDGTQLVYTVWRTKKNRSTSHGDLYIINADGSGRRPLVRGQNQQIRPQLAAHHRHPVAAGAERYRRFVLTRRLGRGSLDGL